MGYLYENPKIGSRVLVSTFLLLPRRMINLETNKPETRWLKHVYWELRYTSCVEYGDFWKSLWYWYDGDIEHREVVSGPFMGKGYEWPVFIIFIFLLYCIYTSI